ncbi:MAG TPA: hypothetical protein VLB90_03390 [Pseudomonadales bacterium]|nr:hypothetical protein [Pseudomonadales bacterium]
MRNVILLSTCLFLLSACGGTDNYWGSNGGGDNYYGGGYGGNNGYGNYYPYGNPNYSRNNIYYMDGYRSCSGYVYQGYCYRDKDDMRAAMYWDQQHGRDDNWHKKRKDWCNHHDCRRDHDTHDDRDDNDHHDRGHHYGHDDRYGTTDAKGRPLEPRVERDRAEQLHPQQREQEPRRHEGRNDYRSNSNSSEDGQHNSSHGGAGRSDRNGCEQIQRRQQQAEPVQRSQPASSNNSSEGRNQSQGRHHGKPVDVDATPE